MKAVFVESICFCIIFGSLLLFRWGMEGYDGLCEWVNHKDTDE